MQDEFIKLVTEEFEKRKLKNPKYSLRAFARDLDSNPATISQAMRKRRGLSSGSIKNIIKKLGLDINFQSVPKAKKKADLNFDATGRLANRTTSESELFEKWYISAILHLSLMKNNKSDPGWISQKLNITELQAKEGLKKLSDLGLICIDKDNLVRKSNAVVIKEDIPSQALIQYYRMQMQIGLASLSDNNIADSKFATTHLLMSKNQLIQLEKHIIAFLRNTTLKFESSNSDELYTFIVGAFLAKADDLVK